MIPIGIVVAFGGYAWPDRKNAEEKRQQPIHEPTTASPQRRLTRREKIEGLSSRAQTGRTLLWLGAYKAYSFPLDQFVGDTKRWTDETTEWLKQNLGEAYALRLNNAYRMGKKEYPGEIRMGEAQDSADPATNPGIRRDLVNTFYTLVVELEEILKEYEAKEN